MVKILFMIDDDADDREVFQEAISACSPDIELVFACDGIDAFEILSSRKLLPDMIFLDDNMPRMNGLQCLKALKADPSLKTIPTIMYTTSGDREQEKVMRLLGADHYLRKTTSFRELCSEVKIIIESVSHPKT